MNSIQAARVGYKRTDLDRIGTGKCVYVFPSSFMSQTISKSQAASIDPLRCIVRSAINTRGRCFTARWPAIFHVTHHKAGSQWIYRLFMATLPSRVVQPTADNSEFLDEPIKEGFIYPTLYLAHDVFFGRSLPPDWIGFVVIRDLRDTLISAYFSMKFSHVLDDDISLKFRETLTKYDQEDGLLCAIEQYLPRIAQMQRTWLGKELPVFRYEDLLENDTSIFCNLLLDRAKLPISRTRMEKIVNACRFQSVTKGRERGTENVSAHERKGIAGDWRNHFTPRVRARFKEAYNDLLVAAGYEQSSDW